MVLARNIKPGKANLNTTVSKKCKLSEKCCIILCNHKDTEKKWREKKKK